MTRYQHQLETLTPSSHSTYLRLLESGMFWVWFPWAKGDYQQDVEKAKEVVNAQQDGK